MINTIPDDVYDKEHLFIFKGPQLSKPNEDYQEHIQVNRLNYSHFTILINLFLQ